MSSLMGLFYRDNFMRILLILDGLEKGNKNEEISCLVDLMHGTFSKMELTDEFPVFLLFIEILTDFEFSEKFIQVISWPNEFIQLIKRFVQSKVFKKFGKAANSLGLGPNTLILFSFF